MDHFYLILEILLVLSGGCNVNGIVGYDCSHSAINVTTIALDNIPECTVPVGNEIFRSETIQMIQLADNYPVHVYSCKVVVSRLVTHCGMHNHASIVSGGLANYIKTISRTQCKDMHSTLIYKPLEHIVIDGLIGNSTTTRTLTLSGTISQSGDCRGGTYSDIHGSWADVIVQGTITIMLNDYEAYADTTHDKIRLVSGVTCKTSRNYCMDSDAGFTMWEMSPLAQCDSQKHLVLYEGPANVSTVVTSSGLKQSSYIVENENKVFALRTTGLYSSCMFKSYTTEHPKLIIIPSNGHPFYFKHTDITPSSMDLMAYINAKFVYVERSHLKEIRELYAELSIQRCNIERKTLANLLSLAIINPPEFAFNYMDSPGFTAVTAGEVVHVIQCPAIDVIIRKTDKCFHELPVSYNNKSIFLTPRSRLVQVHGTEIECDMLVGPRFRIEGKWYSIGPHTHQIEHPKTLTPEPLKDWTSSNLRSLATAGIYSYDESEKLRSMIMNPYERSAITNVIVRGVNGMHPDMQGLSIGHMVDEDIIGNIGDRISHKVWGWFRFLGNITSGFLGFYVVLRICKFMLDTAVHCKALHEVYGFSAALLGGLWDSVSTYLLHRAHNKDRLTEELRQTARESQPLSEILVCENSTTNQTHSDAPPTSNTHSIYPSIKTCRDFNL